MSKFSLKVPDSRNVLEKLSDRLLQKTVEVKSRVCKESAKILNSLGQDITPCDLYTDELYDILQSGDQTRAVSYILSSNTGNITQPDISEATIRRTLTVIENISRSINSLSITLNSLTRIVNKSTVTINITSEILQGIKIATIAADTTLAATAATPTGIAATFARFIQKLDKLTDKFRADINGPSSRFGEKGLKAVINRSAAVLAYVNIQVLALQVILKVVISVLESKLTDDSVKKLTSNIKLESLEQISPELATTTKQNYQNLEQTYKGYTIQVKQEPSTIPGAVKSFAIAFDQNGNVVYRGTASFSPNINILVEEVKFALDRLIG